MENNETDETKKSTQKIKIICKCESLAFLQKYKKELQLLFQSKYKSTTPVSEKSDDSTSKPCSSKAELIDEPADLNTRRTVCFSRSTELNVSTPPPSLTSFHTKVSDVVTQRQSQIPPIFDESKDYELDENKSIKSNSSLTLLRTTQSLINIKEKRNISLEMKIEQETNRMNQILFNIEKDYARASKNFNEKVLEKTLKRNVGSVHQSYTKLQFEKKMLEKGSTIELLTGVIRPAFDITEQEYQLQNLIDRIDLTLQSIQDHEIKNIMDIITELKRKEVHPRRRSSQKLVKRNIDKVFLEPPSIDAEYQLDTDVQLSLQSYLKCVAETEVEEETYYHELFSPRDDFSNVYKPWFPSELHKEEYQEEMEGYSFLEHFSEPIEDSSTPMKRAEHYLKTKRIFQLFKFLGAHLVAAIPDNPIMFLVYLLERCCDYRKGLCTPPLLFELCHVESMYFTLDPMGTGEISIDQYTTGMFTLGIVVISRNPQLNEHLMINRQTFINDACNKLIEQFDLMVKIPGQNLLQLSSGRSFSRTTLNRSG